ncbi:hypothetical protein [Streptomyces sp. NPDC096030]|uniref:hypothetical protein n=1 Tax=Streptomyces sp. NPDC096030 TaxID=3155423 RepID=UPI003327451D
MPFDPTDEDIVEARKQGDIKALLLAAAGLTIAAPKQRTSSEPEAPCYHIPRPGAWPCGTAATGPTPKPCAECAATEEPR